MALLHVAISEVRNSVYLTALCERDSESVCKTPSGSPDICSPKGGVCDQSYGLRSIELPRVRSVGSRKSRRTEMDPGVYNVLLPHKWESRKSELAVYGSSARRRGMICRRGVFTTDISIVMTVLTTDVRSVGQSSFMSWWL